MTRFSRELGNFFTSLGLRTIRTAKDILRYLRRIPASTTYITPGHVLAFKYNGGEVVALVVSTKRGNGRFISTKGNPLITVFKLNGLSEVVLQVIMENLYRNPGISSYKGVTKALKTILGKDRFRTYNLRKMYGIHQIEIRKEELSGTKRG